MEKLKEKIIWKKMGRETIEYAGRVEVIPSAIWMSEKEAKNEIRKRLFDEQILLKIMDYLSLREENLKEIRITHASCWIGYHVFCLEMKESSYHRVAFNLLPHAEKKPVFKEFWEKGIIAWKKTGVIARPIILSEDGRFFVQEWVEGEPVSSITGERWKSLKKRIIASICEAIAKLNKIGLVFFPLLDYEIMYSEEDDKVVFLDITRLKDGGFDNARDLFELCRKSAINSTPVSLREFCTGLARVYTPEEFTDFIGDWGNALKLGDLGKLWNESNIIKKK
ncbi:MAG TPA: hypothetical protein EYP30_01450 [Archaeoglobaceae archaeon]|nr:hypothetical protein [Archaeoglobaceae archaeon]